MDGSIFKDGIPMHTAIDGLQGVQSIIDKSFLVLHSQSKITNKTRQTFYLRSQEIRKGSLLTTFDIIFITTNLALPLFSQFGSQDIWSYTKDTWNFLKFVFERAHKGQEPTYITNRDGTVNVSYGDTHNTYNAPVINIAKLALPSFQSLTKLLGHDLTSIEIGNKKSPEIIMDTADKGLFDVPSIIDDLEIELDCDIFKFNKRINEGKLTVLDSQPIPEGEYNFSVIGDQNHLEYIYSMLNSKTRLKCLREIAINPLLDSKIKKLHVVGLSDESRSGQLAF